MNRPGILSYVLFFCLFIAGCAQMPGEIMSPSMKIDIIIENNTEKYLVQFSGGIRNSNDNTCFTDCRGSVVLKDPETGTDVLSLAFDLPIVFPLSTGIVEIRETVEQDRIMPVLDLLEIDRESLLKERTSSTVFIDRDKAGLEIDSCSKKDIIEVLKGRTDEKN